MAQQDCIFCKVVAGEISADVVYTDEGAIAFRDINPQAPVHVLVIPREHLASLDEAARGDEASLGRLLRVAARVANAEGLSEKGYRTVINTGAGAGQSVFHLHLHVIGGRPLSWPPG
ncbi:MAG TPA: histidine triad nucleotide-binding protein [Pyrinomonadaceae bacterium]|jgi:histidine triad (HIT) family protein|nr:histidine triad nucleotide-binding protein [Pyrinomonadaceae bacterium]